MPEGSIFALLLGSGILAGVSNAVAGGRIARWLPAWWLKRIVVGFGAFLTVYYFYKYYG